MSCFVNNNDILNLIDTKSNNKYNPYLFQGQVNSFKGVGHEFGSRPK